MTEESKGAARAVKATADEAVKVEEIAETSEALDEVTVPRATASAAETPADEPVPTLREIFSLPEKEADPADVRWKTFQETLSREVKGIKWTAAMPDLAPKICELLDIKIPDVLIAAWKKIGDLQKVLEESKKTPEKVVYLDLADHSIDYQAKPSIDVKIKSATVKKIELLVQLDFKLKGFVLKIQNGAIREMETGNCEVKGTLKYGNLSIAEKKLEPIKLPLSIPITSIGNSSQLAAPASETESKSQEATPITSTETTSKAEPPPSVPSETKSEPDDSVERIEL